MRLVLPNSPTLEGGAATPTEYLAIVQRVLKGKIKKSTITVRVLGGKGQDGSELHVFGVPTFKVGERALLFLLPHEDDTYRILHWALGTFRIIERQNRLFAARDLSEANVLSKPGQEGLFFLRDAEKFAAWLRDRATSKYREADYFEPVSRGSQTAPFTLLEHEGKNLRWFEFDRGQQVKWRFNPAGQSGKRGKFKAALKAWNRESRTPINYAYAGKTNSTNGLLRQDGVNAIVFDDPNDDFPGRFDCAEGGGTLAGASGWIAQLGTFQGRTYRRIAEMEIIVNDGVACFLRGNSSGAKELFAHELGHTLGIGHSCGDEESGDCDTFKKDNALMRSFVHNDRRGASLQTDDIDALQRLYKKSDDPPSAGLAAPANLRARTVSGAKYRLTRIRLQWQDWKNEPEFYEFWRRVGMGNWQFWLNKPDPNPKRIAKGFKFDGATPGETYTFRVRARNGDVVSDWSNTASVTMPSN